MFNVSFFAEASGVKAYRCAVAHCNIHLNNSSNTVKSLWLTIRIVITCSWRIFQLAEGHRTFHRCWPNVSCSLWRWE